MGSRWEMERKKDPYYRRAKSEDYRSRASYKNRRRGSRRWSWLEQNQAIPWRKLLRN